MQAIEELEREALAEIDSAASTEKLRELEIKYLGKSGQFPALFKRIGEVPPDEKKQFGQKLNDGRKRVEEALAKKEGGLKGGEREAQFEREKIDVTMPGRPGRVGRKHVLQQ